MFIILVVLIRAASRMYMYHTHASGKHGKGKLRPTGETIQHTLALYARIIWKQSYFVTIAYMYM